MIFSWVRLVCVMFNIWASNSYFLLGPFVCWGLCSRHFLDELAESPRLRQRSSSLGRGQEELGSGGDPGPGSGGRASVTGAGTAANAVTSSCLTLRGEPLGSGPVSRISILSHATKKIMKINFLYSINRSYCKLLLIEKCDICDMSPGEWQWNCETR